MLQCFLLSPLGWWHLFMQHFAQGSSAELRAPIYWKPPPKPAANALSVVTAAQEKHLCCDISCRKHHWLDDLSSELLLFSLPHLFLWGSRTRWLSCTVLLSRAWLLHRAGANTALLLCPLPARRDGNEKMAVIVKHVTGGMLIQILINFVAFLCITSIYRKVTTAFQLGTQMFFDHSKEKKSLFTRD